MENDAITLLLQIVGTVLSTVLGAVIIGQFKRIKDLENKQHELQIQLTVILTNYSNIATGISDIKTKIEKQSEKLQELTILQSRGQK